MRRERCSRPELAELLLCCDLAASSLEDRSQSLRWALARLPLASDAEASHDARVALRRLRSASIGFSDCLAADKRWTRRLRWAERALGGLRDAEVRLELLDEALGPVAVSRDRSDDPRIAAEPGGPIVMDRAGPIRPGLRGLEMEARRALADSTAAEIARHRELALTQEAMERYQSLARPPQVRRGHKGVTPVILLGEQQLPRLFKRAGRGAHTDSDLHRRRVQTRKLRYRLELFAPVLGPGHQTVLQELRQVQSLLGRFHDLVVLSAWIDDSSRALRHELRPALRRLTMRVSLEQQVAKEAADSEMGRLDEANWWAAAQAACLGGALGVPSG
ncbi:MAG TPA: CHAD domain-containing protein [Candidatus Saccharimonadales bacterium]|nr:CHAD domain-containing protein [Candidatus Saccharimonadales bacterium]